LVLRWAKERLDETSRANAARDAVLAIAQYNHGNMNLPGGRWITRDFAQKFMNWNMRCFQLVFEYLEEDVRHSSDWALLLAVERLAEDLFYSSKADQTNFLINALMENPRMKDRAFGMAMSVAYYQFLGKFPSTQSLKINWSHRPKKTSAEMKDLKLLYYVASDLKKFDDQRWSKYYIDRPSLQEAFIAQTILLNITRIETMLNTSVQHPDIGQQGRKQVIKDFNVWSELATQLNGLSKSRIVPSNQKGKRTF
jgi:hypothetical protein